jgi:hypothetical protein
MKLIIIILTFCAFISCQDKPKKAEQKKQAYADSAKIDSVKSIKLKQQNNETDKILWNNKLYTFKQLDSIFAGGESPMYLPSSNNNVRTGSEKR